MINHCATFCVSSATFWILAKLRFWNFSKVFFNASNRVHRLLKFLVQPTFAGESRWFLSPRQQKQHLWAHRVFSINFRGDFINIFVSQFSVTNICRIEIIVRTITRSKCMPWIHTQVYRNFFGDICFCVYLLRTHSLRHANKAPLNTFRCSQ